MTIDPNYEITPSSTNVENDQPRFINRIKALPLVVSGAEKYHQIKESSKIIQLFAGIAEETLSKVSQTCLEPLEPYINDFGCRQLNVVEDNFPLIKSDPKVIVEKTKEKVYELTMDVRRQSQLALESHVKRFESIILNRLDVARELAMESMAVAVDVLIQLNEAENKVEVLKCALNEIYVSRIKGTFKYEEKVAEFSEQIQSLYEMYSNQVSALKKLDLKVLSTSVVQSAMDELDSLWKKFMILKDDGFNYVAFLYPQVVNHSNDMLQQFNDRLSLASFVLNLLEQWKVQLRKSE